MFLTDQGPSCHLQWTVSRVSASFYAVSASINGLDYDFVGNFASLKDAHQAGRRYVQQMMHGTQVRYAPESHQIAA